MSFELLKEGAALIRTTKVLAGHDARVSCVAFSPRSWMCATGSYDSTLRVWSRPQGGELWKREGLSHAILSLAFSHDERWIAVGSNRLEVLHRDTGQLLRDLTTVRGHTESIVSLAFSPRGQYLLWGTSAGDAYLWDSVADQISIVGNVPGRVHSVTFAPDEQVLVAGDAGVSLFEVGIHGRKSSSHILGGSVYAVAFSPNGSTLACAGANGKTVLLRNGLYHAAAITLQNEGPVTALAWSPDSTVLAAYVVERVGPPFTGAGTNLWHIDSREVFHCIPGSYNSITTTRDPLAISSDGKLLAAAAPASGSDLALWDIEPLGLFPPQSPQKEKTTEWHTPSVVVQQHLLTLPLSHAQPPTPPRPAIWLRGAAAVGARLPLFLAQDLGTILVRPEAKASLMRPAHLPADLNTSGYLNFLQRAARQPLLREVSSWDISDAMAGVVLARLVEGVDFPKEYALPGGLDLVGFTRALGSELDRADPTRLWQEADPGTRPDFNELLTPAALARVESNLRALNADELRFLHEYGPRFAGAPDPRSLLDLFSLLNMPPAVRLALSQMLRLLPRVSEAAKGGGAQTYSIGGYAGLTRKGNLDNLVPTELAHTQEMFLHRMLNREALYYGREAERERRREMAYIVTQAGLDLLGDGEVLARGLTLALAQTMLRRGYVVEQSFVGSTWERPAPMSSPSDVQRVLYYRDRAGLRPAEMLAAVLKYLRSCKDSYRAIQVMWVVSEFWDADAWAEHAKLYAALRRLAEHRVWVIRVGKRTPPRGEGWRAAIGQLGDCQVINSELLWAEHQPPARQLPAPQPESVPGGLRFDGFYRARGDVRYYWYYLKFFRSGKVWYIASNNSPRELAQFISSDLALDEQLSHGSSSDTYVFRGPSGIGTFKLGESQVDVLDTQLSFSIRTFSGVIEYKGVLSGDVLKLEWWSEINGREGEEEYRFVGEDAYPYKTRLGV